MILSFKFFILFGLAFCCSNNANSVPPPLQDEGFTCAYAFCIEQTTIQPNGNKMCSQNYASLQDAQYYCHRYQCDAIIQYDFNGSDKFEIVKKSCSGNHCRDSLESFKVIEPDYIPSKDPKYSCVDSTCITQSLQPNGNQFCTINYANLDMAQSLCKYHNCDTIIRYFHNDNYMYELLRKIDENDAYADVCGQFATKNDIEFISSINDDWNKIIESELEIRDHSNSPFKQYTTYYPDENITEITVEEHNDYERNTFFLLPSYQLRVAVIGNHSCIFSDIHAYDLNPEFEKKKQSSLTSGIADRNNVITIQIQSSFKPSDIKINFLPNRVIEKCENKDLLELEYLRFLDDSTSETITITDAPLELPVKQHNRNARSTKTCPLSNCAGSVPPEYLMAAQCSGERQCPSGGKLPTCWYAMGTTQHNMQQYYHFTNSQMSCVPCCNVGSRNSKMPVCSQVSSLGALCDWYFTKGRCPDFR